jgi:tRNA A-37 threonylcarbamoyl transferase component Bud32
MPWRSSRVAPELSRETNDLLRQRLRIASLLLFAGFFAFFIKGLFHLDQLSTQLDLVIFWSHFAVTVITGMIGMRLCTNCAFVLGHLRVVELVTFGAPALFFLLLSYFVLTTAATKGYVLSISHFWMMLIFTYALFVPNKTRRAAIVIGIMAALPVLVVVGTYWTFPVFATLLQTVPEFNGHIGRIFMLMTLTAVTATWGVHTMGNLRREAFEARQLGQYRLKEKIGEGGMGEVYLAEHLLLKRPCAIKLIRPENAGDTRALARFEREVRATAKLTHWNTVEIYDYGRADDGTFYYAMEYLPGLNLRQMVENHGPLPAGRVIHLLLQICDALDEAHDQGLIHRDIKPANIFATHRGNIVDVVKLLDFGLAKPLTSATDASLTVEGSITGSPLFMSPEQALGDTEADARSDIYSLGVVAYYLLTGEPPFNSSQPLKVMMSHARDDVEPPSNIQLDVPADLERVVLRCLEKDRDHRYPTADALHQALAACEDAGTWNREAASDWWLNFGCPKKKAFDEKVLAAAGT